MHDELFSLQMYKHILTQTIILLVFINTLFHKLVKAIISKIK